MKDKLFLITTIVLFIILIVAVFFVFSFNGQIQDLEEDKDDLESELSDTEDELKDLEDEFDDLLFDYDRLSEYTFCGGELLPLAGATYTDNDDMLEALSNWVNEMWGTVTNTNWMDLIGADGAESAMHLVETNAESYLFLVYFDDSAAGHTNAVFYMNNQCWLDTDL